MNVLLTGATGYIGQHLLRSLLAAGHHVTCCVRSPSSFRIPKGAEDKVSLFKVDFVKMREGRRIPGTYDVAYYLIHSMAASTDSFDDMETRSAENFLKLTQDCKLQQVIYLSGISNDEALSKHLRSRLHVEEVLRSGSAAVTVLRAGIIVGAGSASFELIRDIVEKLPIMITPKWLMTRCQPISIGNVLEFLVGVALQPQYFDQSFDIGGPDILSYKEMLLAFAKVRGFRRRIFTVPVMTPRLSSYWLYFVTSVSYPLAVNLVNSMKVDVICKPNDLAQALGIQLIPYEEAIVMALSLYEGDGLFSSWKDALSSSYAGPGLEKFKGVPRFGCLSDRREKDITGQRAEVLENIWAIGGQRGWYYGNWLWRMRGFVDKLMGGVGVRRGRTNDNMIEAGDALDFWRVMDADHQAGRLLLFAEMKLPGEAWLEFQIQSTPQGEKLVQTATFRPKGLLGRLYWYAVVPFHFFVFNGMIRNIVAYRPAQLSGAVGAMD
jgi:uncharacterized protein YbjT (DUF2867 family)